MREATDIDRKDWANTDLVRRGELQDGLVHELNSNNKVYVLKRLTPEPRKAKEVVGYFQNE